MLEFVFFISYNLFFGFLVMISWFFIKEYFCMLEVFNGFLIKLKLDLCFVICFNDLCEFVILILKCILGNFLIRCFIN